MLATFRSSPSTILHHSTKLPAFALPTKEAAGSLQSWPTISVRLYHPHLPTPILTGKSESRPEAKTADGAGLPDETEIDAKIDHGARMQASNGRRSAEMTMNTPDETKIQASSAATEITIDRGQGP